MWLELYNIISQDCNTDVHDPFFWSLQCYNHWFFFPGQEIFAPPERWSGDRAEQAEATIDGEKVMSFMTDGQAWWLMAIIGHENPSRIASQWEIDTSLALATWKGLMVKPWWLKLETFIFGVVDQVKEVKQSSSSAEWSTSTISIHLNSCKSIQIHLDIQF